MAVLVDPPVTYPDCGLRWKTWSHLASDESFDELHAMARALGLKRSWFQGDHYDVTPRVRARALAAGAHAVGSAELGLRMHGRRGDRRRARADARGLTFEQALDRARRFDADS